MTASIQIYCMAHHNHSDRVRWLLAQNEGSKPWSLRKIEDFIGILCVLAKFKAMLNEIGHHRVHAHVHFVKIFQTIFETLAKQHKKAAATLVCRVSYPICPKIFQKTFRSHLQKHIGLSDHVVNYFVRIGFQRLKRFCLYISGGFDS
jgi:hypothetical protein